MANQLKTIIKVNQLKTIIKVNQLKTVIKVDFFLKAPQINILVRKDQRYSTHLCITLSHLWLESYLIYYCS